MVTYIIYNTRPRRVLRGPPPPRCRPPAIDVPGPERRNCHRLRDRHRDAGARGSAAAPGRPGPPRHCLVSDASPRAHRPVTPARAAGMLITPGFQSCAGAPSHGTSPSSRGLEAYQPGGAARSGPRSRNMLSHPAGNSFRAQRPPAQSSLPAQPVSIVHSEAKVARRALELARARHDVTRLRGRPDLAGVLR